MHPGRMSAGSADAPPAAGCFGGARGGSNRGGAPAVGCFGPERAPLLDGTRSARRADSSAGRARPWATEYRSNEDTLTEEDDAEYGIPLETREPRGAFDDGDPAETRGGDARLVSNLPEIRASAIRPALVVLAVAAAPFAVGLALGYPRASAATLLCAETTGATELHDNVQPDTYAYACVTETRAAKLENLFLAGAAAGALVCGKLVDAVGRRGALRLAGAVSTLGWIAGELVFGAATNGGALGRVLVGVGAGAITTASILLAAETAAPASRAFAVASTQLALALGLLLMHLFALIARTVENNADVDTVDAWKEDDASALITPGRHPGVHRPHWRQLALFAAATNACLAAGAGGVFGGETSRFLFSAVPESPRWLARRGHREDVHRAIASARGLSDTDPRVEQEAARILDDARLERERRVPNDGTPRVKTFAASHLLTRGNLSRALFKSTVLIAVTTLGGLSLPSNTASVALVSGFEDTPRAAWAFSVAKLLGALLAVVASRPDPDGFGKLSRRVTFLLSVCGMLAANVAVVASLVVAPPLYEEKDTSHGVPVNAGDAVRALAPLLFASAHALGAATTPWLVAAEAFPFAARGLALGLVAAAHWSFLLDVQRGFGAAAAYGTAGGVGAFSAFGLACAAGVSLLAPRGQTLVPDADGVALERAGARGKAGNADRKRTIGIAQGF